MIRVLIVSEGPHDRAVEPLVNRLLLPRTLDVEHERMASPKVRTHRGSGGSFYKRALAWAREARKRGFDAIVLLIDRDHDGRRSAELDRAQVYTGLEIRRAFGVAIETFDAWILADEKAIAQVLGKSVGKQKKPESLPSPKTQCVQLLEESPRSIAQRDMYREVCECVDIDVLEKRCPKGFGPFAARIRSLFD